MPKLLRTVLIVVGVLLIVAGIVLMVVIVPSMRVFPDDVDTTRTYDLAYLTLLNAQDMSFIRIGPEGSENLRIERNIFVEEVDGNQTLVRETQTLYNGDTALMQFVKRHALDRKSMEALADPPAAWTETDGYRPREGIVIGWGPEGVKQENYTAWSDDYGDTVEMVFEREEEHGGINTYYFTSESEPLPISEEYLALMELPTSLPVTGLSQLAAGLEIEDEELRTQVERFLPLLMAGAVRQARGTTEGQEIAVPLLYLYDYYGEYWVEPDTGVLIDTKKHEHRAVTFPEDIMEALAASMTQMGLDPNALTGLLPVTVNEFEYQGDPASVEDARLDAQDAIDQLNLFGKTIPMIAIALGIVALLAGWYLHFTLPAPKPGEAQP